MRPLQILSLALLFFLSGCVATATNPPAKTSPLPEPEPIKVTADPNTPPLLTVEDFVPVKGGRFMMGDIYGTDITAKPPHAVTVDDFFI